MTSLQLVANTSGVGESTGRCFSGRSERPAPSKLVDLNGSPLIPKQWEGARPILHRKMRGSWDPANVNAFVHDRQKKSGGIKGRDLKELVISGSRLVLNANAIDYWMANQAEFPQDLRREGVYYYAWGTLLLSTKGDLIVRCIFISNGNLRDAGGYVKEQRWGENEPALIYDSKFSGPQAEA